MSSNDRRRGRGQRKNDEHTREEKSEQLDSDNVIVVPANEDVLFGRGRSHFFHPGNIQFRHAVGMNLGAYLDASKKSQKSRVVNKIVDEALAQGVRFLEQDSDSKLWYDVGVKRVRDKVGHALRDASQDKSQSIKNVHLDLMQRRMFETVSGTRTGTDHADLSVVNASATLTSLVRAPHGIVASSENKGIGSDSEYHVERERTNFSLVASLSAPSQITSSTKEIEAKGMCMYHATEDCSPDEEMKKNSKRKSSSRPSSRSSALDACLDVINDMNGDELDDCLEADSKLH